MHITIQKFEQNYTCEDSSYSNNNFIAISDGAGGGGIYADKWSEYLVKHITDKPITNTNELNDWLDSFCDEFSEKYEQIAKQKGGLFLNKFYDEGSYATLAVCWKTGKHIKWFTYGDSVIFCYNKNTQKLSHSFSALSDFNKPPYLLNWQNEINTKACEFKTTKNDSKYIYFAASDALSHYILMMYLIYNADQAKYKAELNNALNCKSKNSNYILSAINDNSKKTDFYTDILHPLINNAILGNNSFAGYIQQLIDKNFIAADDYSFAVL